MNEQETTKIKSMILDLEAMLEPEKTYPIGYDPDGEWTVTMYVDGLYRADHRHSISDDAWKFTIKKGLRFATQEQAEKVAAGKNAMRELVMVVQMLGNNPRLKDIFTAKRDITTVCRVRYRPFEYEIDIPVDKRLIRELGEDKIKLALEWGM